MQDVLSKLSETRQVVLPVSNNWGRYKTRLIKANNNDGWYLVELGNDVKVLRPASLMEIDEVVEGKDVLTGMALSDEFVPINFNNLRKKTGGNTARFLLGDNVTSWDHIKTVLWEDGRLYFAGIDYSRDRKVVEQVKQAFEEETSIDHIKGATPELRYYFLCQGLYRSSYRAYQDLLKMNLSKDQKHNWIKKFKADFKTRLKLQIENAGGELVSYTKEPGGRYLVTWKVGGTQIKSVINDRMSIIDLGFCASGHDKEHTLQSAIHLSKIYQEEGGVGYGGLYITRE